MRIFCIAIAIILCSMTLGFTAESTASEPSATTSKEVTFHGTVTSVDSAKGTLSVEVSKDKTQTFTAEAKMLETVKVGAHVTVVTKDGKVISVTVAVEKKSESTEAEKK